MRLGWVEWAALGLAVLGACARDDGMAPVADTRATTPPTLTGTIRDRAGAPVSNARVEAGTISVLSDPDGRYRVVTAAGEVTLKVTRNWFTPYEETVTVAGLTTRDPVLDELPMQLMADDLRLADRWSTSFDWSQQTIAVAVAPEPTRRDLDNAIHFRNPACYQDTSDQPPLAPAPPPDLAGGRPRHLHFPVAAGRNPGVEALDPATITDALADTPFGVAPRDFMMFRAVVAWLDEIDPTGGSDLRAVGDAVRQQGWGSSDRAPQQIERLFIDLDTGALWAEVVFAPFVQVGPGIRDDDDDGRPELYGRVGYTLYTRDTVDVLINTYSRHRFGTHALAEEVTRSLRGLPTEATPAQIERFVGQPFDVPGLGTIRYPFVVLRHPAGQRTVILVGP